jgi:hypothetical protein
MVGNAPGSKAIGRTTSPVGSSRIDMIAKSVLALEGERTALIRGKDDLEGLGRVLLNYDNETMEIDTKFIRRGPIRLTTCRIRVRRSSRYYIVRVKEIPNSRLFKGAALRQSQH